MKGTLRAAWRKLRPLFRAGRNRRDRERLTNHDFTIIASNCIGGVIYHELGLPFTTPTVNLFLVPGDYLKFVKNLDYYLSLDMTEAKDPAHPYPVGVLGDIRVYLVHYHTFEEGKQKWNERKQRINFNNLFLVMSERDGCTQEQMEEFSALPYENKILFTHFPDTDIPCTYSAPGWEENGQTRDLCAYRGAFTGRRWLDEFDFVSFLNKGKRHDTETRKSV